MLLWPHRHTASAHCKRSRMLRFLTWNTTELLIVSATEGNKSLKARSISLDIFPEMLASCCREMNKLRFFIFSFYLQTTTNSSTTASGNVGVEYSRDSTRYDESVRVHQQAPQNVVAELRGWKMDESAVKSMQSHLHTIGDFAICYLRNLLHLCFRLLNDIA